MNGLCLSLTLVVSATLLGGCSVQRSVASGQLDGALRGAPALDTFHDFEASRKATYYLIGRLEGWHRLNPSDATGPVLLAQYWGLAVEGFIEDDLERAKEAGDAAEAERHRQRIRDAYARAERYARRWLELRDPSFEKARETRKTLADYLAQEFSDREDAAPLCYAARAFLGHEQREVASAGPSDRASGPARLNSSEVGMALAEHAISLDEQSVFGLAHVLIGRTLAQRNELAGSRTHFERAERVSGGRFLPALQHFATSYYCRTADRDGYLTLLKRIVAAEDQLPMARVSNGIAKRRAVRYLKDPRWQADCAFDDG